MNNVQTKSKQIILDSFDGVDLRSTHKNQKGSADIVNFRVLSDGSLEKREGYRKVVSLGEGVRAVWSGRRNGEDTCYAVAGNRVVRLFADGTYTSIGTLSSQDGEVSFFFYRGHLYVIDGISIFSVEDSALTVPEGYVPLVGKNWTTGEVGEINEPRNLLSNRARFSYLLGEEFSSVLFVDDTIASVDAIYINGKPIDLNRHSMLSNKRSFTVSGMSSHDSVMVYVTYASSDERLAELLRNTHAVVFGGANSSRPLLWGDPQRPSVIYSAGYVSEQDLYECQRVYPLSDSLYFPAGYEFSVGDGQYSVRAVSRHYDRLLIFTEGGAWMANGPDNGTSAFPVMNINSSVGVISKDAAVALENQPCTVGEKGIFRWNSDTDELNDCNAYCISNPISQLLDDSFYKNGRVFADRWRGELMFTCPDWGNGDVWIYSSSTGKWVRFEGIWADGMFEFFGNIAFFRSGDIFVFDKECADDDGTPIKAVFSSAVMNFGSDSYKKLFGVGLTFEGGDVTAQIYFDGEASSELTVDFKGDAKHRETFKRKASRRFKNMRVSLIADGASRQTVHSLYAKAR